VIERSAVVAATRGHAPIVHSEMCVNWGYDRLHECVEKRAIQEMKHAEKLIARWLPGLRVTTNGGSNRSGS
jgi:bacterioferritin